MKTATIVAVIGLAVAAPALARPAAAPGQLGSIMKRAQQFRDVQMTDDEEQQLGQAVSEKIRRRYGVVQDPAIHRYVTLLGSVLAQASSRPNLTWHFIVLDTDGVNALAAPGGYIHITRGALSLMTSEAQLAGVLGHEIIHVTEKHTIHAIQKGKLVQMGADETLSNNKALFGKLVDKATDVVMAGFGRGEELESDAKGDVLANKVGYDPHGLPQFLQVLLDRNKNSTQKQGLFASHPEMQERLDKLAAIIKNDRLAATATLEARFRKNVSYKPVAIAEVTTVAGGASGLAGETKPAGKEKPAEKPPEKKKGFGLGSLVKGGGGSEKESAEVTGSGASRGVDSERSAKGGSNPAPVLVKVTSADVTAFKKEGQLP